MTVRHPLPRDAGYGLLFAAIGAWLAWTGWRLPPGVAGVPGPGVFPAAVGAALAALGAGLAASAVRRRTAPPGPADGAEPAGAGGAGTASQVGGILALLALYAAVWDVIPFIWRTPPLLIGIYLVLREPPLRSAVVATAASVLLLVVFEILLRVRL